MIRASRLNKDSLHRAMRESAKRTFNEYVCMTHSGHDMDDFLDDDDFYEMVYRVVKMYGREDFDDNDLEYIDEMERDIADLINDFIADEALDDFGYKYGTTNYRCVASNIIAYIQAHLNELY